MGSTLGQMQEREKYWSAHIDRIEASKMSHQDYCNENGLKIHTLRYWTRILGRTRVQNKASKLTFASLTLTDTVDSARSENHTYEVVLGIRVLRISQGFCVSEVKKLVEILSC